MKKDLFSRRLRRSGLGGILTALIVGGAATPALASTTTTTSVAPSGCTAPTLTQPFLSIGDSNWYTLAPGEAIDSFAGSGWTVSGGASIETTTLADGTTGQVLNLPSGSTALSPIMCVDDGYQMARTEVRDVAGTAGVQFDVSYEGTSAWSTPVNTGQVHGQGTSWTLSNPVNVQPSKTTGWQYVRFEFVPLATTSDSQIYNFWVDPRMSY